MNSIKRVKINYFADRLINVLSSSAQILCLQFLYYAFHRLSEYKAELCFLIFFAQIPLTLNTLCNKMYITDDGYIYSSKAGRIIKRTCSFCCLLALEVNAVLILNSLIFKSTGNIVDFSRTIVYNEDTMKSGVRDSPDDRTTTCPIGKVPKADTMGE